MLTVPKLKVGAAQAKVRLLSLEDLPIYIKMLVYANAGVGKTFLGATAPDPLILLTEPEVSKPTLKLAAQMLGVQPKVFVIKSLEDMDAALDYAEEGNHGCKTLVADAFTDLNRFIIQQMVQEGMSRRSTHDPDVPEMGDWYRVEERSRRYLRRLRDLPMHVVANFLLADVRSEQLVAPAIQPKRLMYEVAAYFNTVGELVCKEPTTKDGKPRRELYVESSASRIAKNPGGSLPPIVENPNLTEIFTRVSDHLTVDTTISALAGNTK